GGMLGDLGSYELGPPSEHLADVERGRPAAIGDERTEHSRHRFRIPAVTPRSRVDDLAAQACASAAANELRLGGLHAAHAVEGFERGDRSGEVPDDAAHDSAPVSSVDSSIRVPSSPSGRSESTAAVMKTCSAAVIRDASRLRLPVSSSAKTSSRTSTGCSAAESASAESRSQPASCMARASDQVSPWEA